MRGESKAAQGLTKCESSPSPEGDKMQEKQMLQALRTGGVRKRGTIIARGKSIWLEKSSVLEMKVLLQRIMFSKKRKIT